MLNEIYDDLLNAVYQRQYETTKHKTVENISKDDFKKVLMEIALTTLASDMGM